MSSFLHSGDLGDIIYFLPSMRELGGGTLYLCSRPFTKEFTPARFEAIRALLLAQPYVRGVEMHKGQKVRYDLTNFRKAYFRGPGRNLSTIQAHYLNTSFVPNIRDPWLTIEDPIQHNRAVIARSPRYHVKAWDDIWPMVLLDHPNPIFVGLPSEHAAFVEEFGKVEYVPTSDLLHIAQLIAGSSIFIGNQSAPYAVAEGLKHPSIQETHPQIADVVFPRANGAFVSTVKDYQQLPSNRNPFAIALQFYEGDAAQAIQLANLIADIEECPREDIEVVLSARFDTPEATIRAVEEPLEAIFPNIHVHRSDRRVCGWPQGCNELWHDSIGWINHLARKRVIHADGVFTFEPDCLPLRKDWLNCLRSDWATAKAAGKCATGHVCKGLSGDPTHINGNLIISTNIAKLCPSLAAGSPGGTAWDVHHRHYILSHGKDAPHIYQTERIFEFSEELFKAASKSGDRPAIWHGIKDPSAVDIARHVLLP